jgi:hypothetical protein
MILFGGDPNKASAFDQEAYLGLGTFIAPGYFQ